MEEQKEKREGANGQDVSEAGAMNPAKDSYEDYPRILYDENGNPRKKISIICSPNGDYEQVFVMGKKGWLPL